MKKNQIFDLIKEFNDWLGIKVKYSSKFQLPTTLEDWNNLEELKPKDIEELPGFYIIKTSSDFNHTGIKDNNKLREYLERKKIIYIGESSTNLKQRISNLRTSIRDSDKAKPHAGGATISKISTDKSNFEIIIFYTAKDEITKQFGGYVAKLFERFLVVKFHLLYGEKPWANKE